MEILHFPSLYSLELVYLKAMWIQVAFCAEQEVYSGSFRLHEGEAYISRNSAPDQVDGMT